MLSDYINKIDFSLYEPHIDILLRALELYAYNLHFVVKKSSEDYYYYNMLILHTYNEILSNYKNNKYDIGYNLINNCELEINRYKRKIYNEKKYKKIA